MGSVLTLVGFVAVAVPVLWFWGKVFERVIGWLDSKAQPWLEKRRRA